MNAAFSAVLPFPHREQLADNRIDIQRIRADRKARAPDEVRRGDNIDEGDLGRIEAVRKLEEVIGLTGDIKKRAVCA